MGIWGPSCNQDFFANMERVEKRARDLANSTNGMSMDVAMSLAWHEIERERNLHEAASNTVETKTESD